MKTNVKKVREFMETFGQHIEPEGAMVLPNLNILYMRSCLIDEESEELCNATNYAEFLDAIGDLLYVIKGAIVESGTPVELMQLVFDEIHRSNMTKLWNDRTIAHTELPDGATHKHVGYDKYVVFRADGKILKPSTYTPPNIQRIIDEYKTNHNLP